jgi:hypothetical protein
LSDEASFLLAFLGLWGILAAYLLRLERVARRLERRIEEAGGAEAGKGKEGGP